MKAAESSAEMARDMKQRAADAAYNRERQAAMSGSRFRQQLELGLLSARATLSL